MRVELSNLLFQRFVFAKTYGQCCSQGNALRIEERADDHREGKFVRAIGVLQRVEIFHVHVDPFSRLDVGDALGEDVGPRGGVFRGTDGLTAEFGDGRIVDTPLAESSIVGIGIGLGILFAPMSGEETRENLTQRASDLADSARDLANQGRDKVRTTVSAIRGQADRFTGTAQEATGTETRNL